MDTITEKQNNSLKTSSKSFDFLEAILNDGTPIKVAKSVITDIIKDEVNKKAMQDNVFIMFHRKSDDYALMVRPDQWKGYQDSGEIAEGVVIVEGGHHLVIAPTESAEALTWSTAAVSGGGKTTTDRMVAMEDWAGKTSNAAQLKHPECQPATTAVGFCSKYARVNANSKGLTAGRWWLPSAAELFLIYANKQKINYALSLITGAQLLQETWYWSSTEFSSTYAWGLDLSNGNFPYWHTKASDKLRVRAVSAFYL